ncbi:delta-12 fatty acid desaturase [Irpex rosettiformis]|uniref:Delta-12 fatty acid desaturase n=1 Tax=Irpex rosettiformis TaxID=378272 RepID=A0ACB8U1Z9_9APHY|nr:delta-12 fatty acid desaturase [Irpex rosettiformis]
MTSDLPLSSLFTDSAEYEHRKQKPFKPPQISLSQIHAAVPRHLFNKSTFVALQYVFRTISLAIAFYLITAFLDSPLHRLRLTGGHELLSAVVQCVLWPAYWLFQSLTFAGFWCISHEAGHGTLSSHDWVNHTIGYTLHTFLLVPYYAWRATHKMHHNAANSVEREENYVPRTRSDYSLPPEKQALPLDYQEIFDDTPLFVLGRMVLMQLLGWQAYLLQNTLGSPMYPPGTNHFSPSSPLFKNEKKQRIVISNIGLAVMSCILVAYGYHVGLRNFIKFYFIPYLLANHWIVMLTFLHHTDPTIPHYRVKEWTWLRGALATVDRPLLGPLGRFFLLNVSHDHIAHHLFSNIPFYNQPKVTEILRELLGEDYNSDSTNSFRALYRSFTQCCFIENEGDIVFYKNKYGQAQRQLATQ